ncbi:hypothetical protein AB1P65_13485 [Roseibium alexandrii]
MNAPALNYTISANDRSRAAFQRNRREIQKTRRETMGLASDFKQAGTALNGMKGVFAGLGVAVAGAGLLSLPGVFRDVIAEASTLAKTADLIGVTTEELQRLTFGFELAGVESQKTEDALKQFNKRLSEAESKGGLLADILDANGVALRDNQGQMRPVMALLRDYANLIQNATSSQDKLSLANEAFGRSGAEMVLALRNGADGVRELSREVDRAGGVLGDAFTRRAEEIDDKFARVARSFEINWKGAILRTASLLDDFGDWSAGVSEQLQSVLPQGVAEWRAGLMLQERLGGGLSGPSFNQGMFFRNDLNLPTRNPLELTVNPTVVPKRAEGRTGAARARREQISQYDRILAQLREEKDRIGLSAAEQRKMTLARMAGVEATSEQGQAIADLIDKISAQQTAQQQANETVSLFGSIASDQIGEFVTMLGLADSAAGRLVSTLAEAALKAAILGEGPLASLFGSKGGGFLQHIVTGFSGGLGGVLSGPGSAHGIAGAFAGMYADGGYLGAGKWGIAGESGPEVVMGPAQIVPGKSSADGAQLPPIIVNVQTPDVDSFRRSESQIGGVILDTVARGRRGR